MNSIRVEFELGLKDSPCTQNCYQAPTSHKMPVYRYPTASDPYVESTWGPVWTTNSSSQATGRPAGGPEFLATRFAIQLPKITVLPAAFLTMKVLPYTIVYRPPGDRSQGNFTTTESYGTNMTVGGSTSIDNTSSWMDTENVTNNLSITDMIAAVQAQDTQSSGHGAAADNNATVGTGLVVSNSQTKVYGWGLGSGSLTSADPTIIPAGQFVTPNTCNPADPASYAASGCAVMPGKLTTRNHSGRIGLLCC